MSNTSPNPVVVEVSRSGWIESVHRGVVIVLDTAGAVQVLGDPETCTYPRSSLKMLQATALGRAGLTLTQRQQALATASHTGSDEHVDVAVSILSDAGLTTNDLQCPPDLPENVADLLTYVAAGGTPARVRHNCSGKHSAMLATCVANGWPTDSYLDPQHPMQQLILDTVGELCSEKSRTVGVDGCGAPVPVVSLLGLATAVRHIVMSPSDTTEGRVSAAARAWPTLVGGAGRCSTELMAACPGLLAKEGAEGVWAAGLPDGRVMVAKIDDGALRALPAILAATVRSWGFESEVIERWEADAVLGGGQPVGALRPSHALREMLN